MKTVLEKFKQLPKSKKIQAVIATVLTISMLTIIPIYAWFSQRKDMAAITKVNAPFNIYITSAQHQSIQEFDLSDIDTTDPRGYKDYVFCVRGSKEVKSYDLQIAHTTNINFKYELYHAKGAATYDDQSDNVSANYVGAIVTYQKDSESQEYTYQIADTNLMAYASAATDSALLSAGYLNGTIANGRLIGNATSPADYTSTDSYQKYAQALYWKKPLPITGYSTDDIGNNDFDHYYVLRLSWTSDDNASEDDIDVVQNNKETDIVYITAAVHSS